MTVDGVAEVIAFILGGLVLLWGFRSLAFASSGGDGSGLHELGTASVGASGGSEDAPEAGEEAATEVAVVKSAGTQRLHQVANYVLSLAAMAALAAMLIGAYLA
ncbi:MAG: hypothetical protein HOH95_06160 [Dehalococcoidia bacterium]|jgi:hypothetical protein|nr:hypothetical protein [Dehalococcoidia bacterium]